MEHRGAKPTSRKGQCNLWFDTRLPPILPAKFPQPFTSKKTSSLHSAQPKHFPNPTCLSGANSTRRPAALFFDHRKRLAESFSGTAERENLNRACPVDLRLPSVVSAGMSHGRQSVVLRADAYMQRCGPHAPQTRLASRRLPVRR